MIARSSTHVVAWFGSICLATSLCAEALQRSSKSPSDSAPAAIGARCISCHESIVRSYRETGMARALEPLKPGELKGLAPVADGSTGFSYQFVDDGKSARIVESWNDPKAPPTSPPAFQATAEIAFAIGAGYLDRSYVSLHGELMSFAPLEVVSAHGDIPRHAALAPGNEIVPGMRFTVPITEECLSCHTDQLPPRDYPLNLKPRRDTWQPSGISCAACHGEVDAHVAWRERELAGKKPDGSDPIVGANFSDPIESVSVCARCHLQGDARIALVPGQRGISPLGADLLASRAVFVAKFPQYDIGFVSHVQQMVKSRCFTQSIGSEKSAMTCVTCHDPHRSSFGADERSSVRAGCLACHPPGEQGSSDGAHGLSKPCSQPMSARANQDCVQCHMPRTGVFDVASVEIHDHFIQRTIPKRTPKSPLRLKENREGKLALFQWPGRPAPAFAEDPGLWMMALMAAGRPELARAYAEREPGPIASALPMYHHVRGSLFERFSKLEEARASYERALELDPAQVETEVNLGPLLARLKRPDEGLNVLGRAIERHPRAEGALRNRALIKLEKKDAPGAVADLEAAYRISPNAAVARLLSVQYREIGRSDLAESWQAASRRLDPPKR